MGFTPVATKKRRAGTNIYIGNNPELLKRLDAVCAEKGLNRSDFVRQALEYALQQMDDQS